MSLVLIEIYTWFLLLLRLNLTCQLLKVLAKFIAEFSPKNVYLLTFKLAQSLSHVWLGER